MTVPPPDSDENPILTGRIAVLLPLPLTGVYDYLAPPGMALAKGAIVRVPLGPRVMTGIVWGAGTGNVEASRLKSVITALPLPPLPVETLNFVDWVADYTLTRPGAVLRMVLSEPETIEAAKPLTGYRKAPHIPEGLKLTAARKRVLAKAGGTPLRAAELARRAGAGPAVVKGLADKGALVAEPMAAHPPPAPPDLTHPGPALSRDQQTAAAALENAVSEGFSVTLLEGVTGSGKTEVYLSAVAEAVSRGGQALVLLPEITLTAQWLERFRRRFGADPALWHSELTRARRRATWRHVAEGGASVVVGARSSLFLPFPDLKTIIVDEEHDGSFKQEEGVIYQARDMAVVRAKLGGCPVTLVSATPSLETRVNAARGRYRRLYLPDRHGGAALPGVEVVDMTRTPPQRQSWLSPKLRAAMTETLERGEQTLLFLNRRGYAPLTLCRTCGHRMRCPNCTAWLVEHRLLGYLRCHHCGFQVRPPESCPSCEAVDSLAACGPGVERLSEEVRNLYPDARVAIAASDTLTTPRAQREMVEAMEAHEMDIVIGTQVIAKGHHFPLLTLVGVVDADLGLSGGDLRAAERTYQLLHQVSGRAGRGERPGRVLVQSYLPEHPVIDAVARNDADGFWAAEERARELAAMPPYGRLVALIVSGEDEDAVRNAARDLARAAPHQSGVAVLGPAPAPLAMIRGRHRQRLLLKAPRSVQVQSLVRAWLARARPHKRVRVQIDVDPYGFL